MNPIGNAIRSFIIKELTTLASETAEKAKQNASWSSRIPDAISIGSVQDSGDGRMFIDIVVDARRDGPAPHAAAFEYGSGIHKKDNPKLYPIKAKNVPNLVFWWEKGNKLFIGKELPFGHPGVEAKPYLKPAIDSTRRTIRGRFLRAFKMGYIESTPRVTIIE